MEQKGRKVIITLPVYNEEKQIFSKSIELYNYINKNLKNYNIEIYIANNASDDQTSKIAKRLTEKYTMFKYFYTPIKGRGKVIYNLWKKIKADCYVYMDIDLSTSLKHLPDLINSIIIQGYDISIGSRNLSDSNVKRSLMRTIISKAYIKLLNFIFHIKISDTQCGFKAFSKHVINTLWDKMDPKNWKGSAWFFDAEILIIAEKLDMKIYQIPVSWEDSPYTTVSLLKDIKEDLRGIIRLIKEKPWGK